MKTLESAVVWNYSVDYDFKSNDKDFYSIMNVERFTPSKSHGRQKIASNTDYVLVMEKSKWKVKNKLKNYQRCTFISYFRKNFPQCLLMYSTYVSSKIIKFKLLTSFTFYILPRIFLLVLVTQFCFYSVIFY